MDIQKNMFLFGENQSFWYVLVFQPELVDNGDTAIPELFLVCLNEERLEGVADLVPHVAVGEIETREDHSLRKE